MIKKRQKRPSGVAENGDKGGSLPAPASYFGEEAAMAMIKSSLVLNDGMSSVLKRINRAMNSTLDCFDAVQKASGQTFNTTNITAARKEIGLVNSAIEEMEQNYRAAESQQKKLNQSINEGSSAAGGLLNKIKGIGAAYLGVKAVNWVEDSLKLYNTQNNAETQLRTVLRNTGAATSAYDLLSQKASSLQGITAYGDEALLGGAAEFATYMSDPEAIAKMMETLTNYAAGMSGGGEVGYKEMVDYATGLGKIVNGSYDAMTKKGFTFTDQQKQIIENGTDMEKALVISDVVSESWADLAANMANTPEGKIIQLKNAFGDMREELAAKIYPYVMKLFNTISKHLPTIKRLVLNLEGPIRVVLNVVSGFIDTLGKAAEYLSEHQELFIGLGAAIAAYYLPSIASAVSSTWEMVTAWLAANWQFALFVAAVVAVTAVLSSLGVSLEWIAVAIAAVTAAYSIWQIVQWGLNDAMYACPVVWIIALVLALIVILIVVFQKFIKEIMGATMWLIQLFTNVALWITNLGIAIWNTIQNVGRWFENLGSAAWTIIENIGHWFANLGLGIWGVLEAVASNIGTAFSDAWNYVQIGFWSMVDVIMQGLKALAEKANSVLGWMGVNIDTSGLDFASKKIDELNNNRGSYKSISDAWAEGYNTFTYGSVDAAFNKNSIDWAGDWDKGMSTFDVFQEGWGERAYEEGYAVGEITEAWMKEHVNINTIMSALGLEDLVNGGQEGYADQLQGIAADTGSIAANTGKSSEELAYLRDIAEKEAINRFTTAEIKVDMTGMNNRIDSSVDLDGIISYFTEELTEAALTAMEGVH